MNIPFLSSVQQVGLSSTILADIFSKEQSSRLLNPTEYLFDILSECVRSNMVNYHLIVKRMLWFTIPMKLDESDKCQIFIDFMYHQSIPELLEGTMIVIKDNHFSDEMMVRKSEESKGKMNVVWVF